MTAFIDAVWALRWVLVFVAGVYALTLTLDQQEADDA